MLYHVALIVMMMLMDYGQLFNDAFERVLKDYSENRIILYSESDLMGYLFYQCRKLMEEEGFPIP